MTQPSVYLTFKFKGSSIISSNPLLSIEILISWKRLWLFIVNTKSMICVFFYNKNTKVLLINSLEKC
jgi:hypothetical protein